MPAVTVGDVLALPVLAGAQVAAGRQGLGRAVRWAHVAEMLDIARLLDGGELVLTTGMGLRVAPHLQEHYVNELDARGSAGLVLELGRCFDAVPPAIVAAADRVGLPVIALGREVPFVRVTEAVHTLIIGRQYQQLKAAETAGARFAQLALGQHGIPALVQALAEAVAGPVLLQPHDPDEPAVAHPPHLAAALLCRRQSPSAWSHPVTVGPQTWGELWLLAGERPLTDLDRLVAARAAVAIAYEVLRQKGLRENWRAETGTLLDDLLQGHFGSEDEITRRALALGFDLQGRWLTAAVLAPHGAADAARGTLTRALEQAGLGVLAGVRQGRVVAVLAGRDAAELVERAATTLAQMESDVAAAKPPNGAAPLLSGSGLGQPVRGATALSGALAEATAALELRRRHPEAGFGPAFASLGAHRLLLEHDRPALSRFVTDELGPLLRYDEARGSELAHTLRVVLDEAMVMARAAARLSLSRHALYHRLSRIRQVLGDDLNSPERRLALALALRAHALLQQGA